MKRRGENVWNLQKVQFIVDLILLKGGQGVDYYVVHFGSRVNRVYIIMAGKKGKSKSKLEGGDREAKDDENFDEFMEGMFPSKGDSQSFKG